MWCLYIQGFCIAADPDDNVAKLFKLFWGTTLWIKDVNIPHKKSLQEICSCSCEFSD